LTSYQPPILQSEGLETRSVPMDDGAGHRDKSVRHLSPLNSPIEVAELITCFSEQMLGHDL
jgi:hypothetical protein